MRVDELIFRELHRLIDDQAQQRLLRLGKQRQQYADCAGGQRADVGNKGEGRRQRSGQPRVGNAAQENARKIIVPRITTSTHCPDRKRA